MAWPGRASETELPAFGKLPLHFELNRGQTDSQVRYLARGRSYTVFLTPTESVLSVRKFEVVPGKPKERPRSRARSIKAKYERLKTETLRIRLAGANPHAPVTAVQELSGKVNYFIGDNPAGWLTDIPIYAKIRYQSVYPGIDLEYYGKEGRLEYDFVVAPGADPGVIKLVMEGPGRVSVDADGQLVLDFPSGPIVWRAPVVFQEVDGRRVPVAAEYALRGSHQFGFRLGEYDPTLPLIIDPALEYSTYLGGTSDDSARAIAVDASGSVYVTGDTSSVNFPTRGPISGGGNMSGIVDAFVTKLGPKGTNVIFSSYLGGNGFESGLGIAVDAGTNVYVTGFTDSSTTFPTKNPFQNAKRGEDDVFLSKLNAAGNSLLYSTYLGGTNDQAGLAVAADNSGGAYVTGDTMSDNFPTRNAFQTVWGGAFTNNIGTPFDAFVAKFNTAASGNSSLIYSSYLGGGDDDIATGIGIDLAGNAYVTGYTFSTNFPTTPTAISTQSFFFVDVFVSKISAAGSNLLYSTYIGGDGAQLGHGIAVGSNNLVYVVGETSSADFPVTPTAFMTTHSVGFNNAFVMKLNLALAGTNSILYSTFLGGNGDFNDDAAMAVAVGTNGLIYVAGMTGSTDFPTSTGAFQREFAGGFVDAFVSVFNPNLSGPASLFYSTYLGGEEDDRAFGIAVDLAGSAYVAGETSSTNFWTTTGALRTTNAGFYDAFVAKIVPATQLGVTCSASPQPVAIGSTITYSITATNRGELAATSVLVSNILPPGVTFVSATATTGTVSHAGGIVVANVGTLATGRGAGVTIFANAVTPGLATNITRISAPQVEGSTNDDTAITVSTLGSLVSVSATISNAFENGSTLPRFRVARSGILSNSITVNYTITGTATPNLDYVALPGSVTIGAGLNAALVLVTPLDDDLRECPETIVMTVSSGPFHATEAPTSATITILDDELPDVSVVATTPTTLEGSSTNGIFTISRAGCFEVPLTVNYTMSGTATNGVAYTALSGSATIPAGSNSVRVAIAPINNSAIQCPRFATLTLSANAAYRIVAPSSDTVTIFDDDARITIAATVSSASEFGTNGVFTLFREGCTTEPLTAFFNITGTASNGLDYLAISNNVTFPVGVTNVTVVIRPLPDAVNESSETVVLTIANNPNYKVGTPGNATVNIANYHATPTVNFTGSPTNGLVPFTVTFTDNSIGAIASRTWNFGDGTSTNTTAPSAITMTKTYSDEGVFTVSLTCNGPLGTNTLTRTNYIVATFLPPQLSVSPASRNFGTISIGQTNTQTFTVINVGGGQLTGTATMPAPFFATGTPFSIGPGQTGIVAVSFIPTIAGSYNANAVFASNGGDSTNALSGAAVTPGLIQALPAIVNFDAVLTGQSAQVTMVVTNLGGTLVTNGTVTVTGGPFSVLSGTPFSVPGNGSTNVVVRFSPLVGATFTNSIVFASANGGTVTNILTGIGGVPPVASFGAAPTSGLIPLAVTFTDTSTGTITNRNWSFGDGTTLNTNVTSFTKTYTARGTYTVRLIVSGQVGASTNTQNNLINAQIPAQQMIVPSSRDYGSVTIGQTNTLNFSVINVGDLTLSGTATAAPPYRVASGTPYSIAGGQTGTVAVSFIPTSTVSFNTNVVFNSNGGVSTNTLTGAGIAAGQIGVSPAVLNFGTRATGTTTQAVFTVTNAGGTTVTNGTATVTGGPFSILSGSTFTVPPGGSTNVVVQFAPLTANEFTNSVIFSTANGGNSTNPVIGAGAIVPVASFNASPTNGVVPLTVTFTDTSSGTITNRFWSFGDGTTLTTNVTSFTKTYTSAGTNTVRLIVTGPVGVSTNTQNNLIRVINPPILNVTPSSHNFGATTLGQTNSVNFSVINTGDQALTGTASVSAPFLIQSGGSFNVAAGQTGTVVVGFSPASVGTFNGNVIFASNGGASTNALTGVGVTAGAISVSPGALDFGTIATGTTSQRVFTVTNTGGTTVTNGTATVTGGPYSIVSGASFSLAAGASTNVVVQFAPVTAGAFTNTVAFNTANGGSSVNTVTGTGAVVPVANFSAAPTNGVAPLTVVFTDTSTGTITNRNWSFGNGTLNTTATSVTNVYSSAGTNTVRLIVSGPLGVSTNTKANLIVVINPPQLNVTPASRDFGPVTIGQTNTMPFSVINTGDQSLTGTATVPAPFAIAGGSPYNVLPGQTGTVSVSFIPVSAGAFNASVIFSSNGGASTNSVAGIGQTPGQIGVGPVNLNFGTILTGTTSQGVFTVTNSGGTPVTNGTATVTGGPFSIVSGASFSVPAGGSTNVVVQFAPVTAGGFTNSVVFQTANGGGSTNGLIGAGADVPVANFTAAPTNGVAPLTVTFTDSSTGTITNRNWSFGDGTTLNTNATSFAKTYNDAGTYTVRLIASGPLGVSTNTKANHIVVINPPQLNVAPVSRDFGAVTIGLAGTTSFSVFNTGDQSLTGTASVGLPFAVASGSPYNIAPGQTGTVVVSFSPLLPGTVVSNVVFASNGGASTNQVTGTGLTPGQIGVSPAALHFGTLATGTDSQQVFVVSNGGETAVTNGVASVGAGPFSITGGAAFSVPAGGTTNVTVRFAPVAAGSFTNNVIFTTANGGNSTNRVTGNGATVPVANFTASPTNGVVPFAVTFTDTSSGTITNRNWSFGDGTTLNTNATSVTHTYTVAGTNTVRLIVSGPVGVSTNTKANLIVGIRPARLEVTPLSHNFGALTIGLTGTVTFAVSNTGDVSLNGSASAGAPFGVASGTPFSIGGGQSANVTVRFTPTTAGSFNGNVIFTSDGGNSTNALTGVGLTPGQLGVSPSGFNFGTIATGTTSQTVFNVTNSGGTPVSNGTATVTGGPYNVLAGNNFNLAAGASTNVVVQFEPVTTGGFTNNLIINSANGGALTNALIGTGATVPVANFTASPTNGIVPFAVTFTDTSSGTITNRNWSFGDGATLNTNVTSVTHTYTVAGTNTVRLIVSGPVGVSTNTKPNHIVGINPAMLVVTPASRDFGSVTIGQTNTQTFSVINPGDVALTGTVSAVAPYAIAAGNPYNIAPKQTGTVSVSFAPLTAGPFNGNVTFSSNGGVSTNPVAGVGLTPGNLVVTPASNDYGTIATGTASQRVFTVTNTGGTTVTNGAATVAAPFSIISGSPFTLVGGASVDVVVQFAPVVAGSFTNNVVLTSANGGHRTNVVTGTGAVVPVANFSASPTTGSVPFMVTFTDTSSGTITNRSWSFGDGATLNTNATTVTHTYTVAGTNSVTLTVSGPVGVNALTKPNHIIALNPPQLLVTPLSREFGAVTIGQTNTLTFSIINLGDLELTGNASAPAPFAITGGSPFNVAGGQTGTVSVSFAPTTAATFNASVAISSNGGNSTNAVSGVGLTPGRIGVSPESFDFGVIATGTTSQRVFTVTNSGGTTVSNGTASVGAPFSIVSGANFSLAGGASTNVVVQFAPVTVGSFTNSIIFNSANGGASTNAVTGSGAVVPVANFGASPTNGPVPLAVTFTDTSSGTITNRNWSFGDGTTLNTNATTVTHTYTAAGTNTVRLIASGPLGASTNNKPNLVVAVNPPKLNVSPASRNFGPVTIGLTNVMTFAVNNTGDLALTGSASVPAPFAVSGGSPFNIAAGQTGTVTVSFMPTTAGTFSNNVVFSSNGGASTNLVTGIGLTPGQLFADPMSFDYGTIAVNSSMQAVFNVSNLGGTTVSNGMTTAIGGGPFVVVSGHTFTLPAGGSITAIVSFTPTSVGSFTGAVVFASANGGVRTNALVGGAAFVPVANFSASPVEGVVPLTVNFTDESTGTISGRQWSFGDGATSSELNPAHQYAVAGSFPVTLTVFGPAGTNVLTKAGLINVTDPNLFTRMAGTYFGLSEGDPPTFENSGLVIVKLGTTGQFKGTYQQGRTKNKFAGTFDSLGRATTTVPRSGFAPVTMDMHLDGTGSDQITGTVVGASSTAWLVANRDVNQTSPSPLAGRRFTALIPADPMQPALPQGDGFATVLIKSNGRVGFAGLTGDGQKFKQQVPVSKFGTWPMYVSLYGGAGAMFGWVTHTNVVGISDFEADILWHRPTGPAGDLFMVGSIYTAPPLGQRVMMLANEPLNARLTFGEGSIASPFVTLITVSPENKVQGTDLTMRIIPPTGLFNGKFLHPLTRSSVPFRGAVLQKQNFGAGFFQFNGSGYVILEPADE